METINNILATIVDEATRAEALRQINALKADGTLTEVEVSDAIDKAKAKSFTASSNTGVNPLLAQFGIIEDTKPAGYRDSADLYQSAKKGLKVLTIEYSEYTDGVATRKYLSGDKESDDRIKEKCLENGLVYMRLSDGTNIPLSKNSLPQNKEGVNVIPNVGDTVSVAEIKLGDVIDTSKNAPLGVANDKSPYGIFEHKDGQKYAICRSKAGIRKLLTVSQGTDREAIAEKAKLKGVDLANFLASM